MIKKILITMALLLCLLSLVGYVFYNTSDQFGASLKPASLKPYQDSKQFNGKLFFNPTARPRNENFSTAGWLYEALFNDAQTRPDRTLEILPVTQQALLNPAKKTRIVWFGHSTFLIQVDQMNLLFDPMLTGTPAPHPMLGSSRYSDKLPISIEDLPEIDAVLLSHDHYDHLDMVSIKQLAAKVGHFYVPLGLGLHLQKWGITAEQITELDWWQTASLGGSEFTLTPAEHFSGRRFDTRNKTLWGGWVVESQTQRIFFSGDSGYGPHFKEVGRRFGELDLALIDTGQYNPRWPNVHMTPEQGVQAAIDAKATVMMPVHWGAFTLSLHDWNEPPERALAEAKRLGQSIVVPQIGEMMQLNQLKQPSGWWRDN
jgi:L-ascorbate metabolism protein UlaG (beta-lactamase superfamily)